MRKNVYTLILFVLVVTSEIIFGKEVNRTKIHKSNKKHNHVKENLHIERVKRSVDDDENKPFWANRGKKNIQYINRYDFDMEKVSKSLKNSDQPAKGPFFPFLSRPDSSSNENMDEFVDYDHSHCKDCYGTIHFDSDQSIKDRRDDNMAPFWGNRGRRSSNEIEETEPFWGNRGRRQDDEPFWGARGRREEEPFWGNRGRRDENEPFWGNRGRRQDSEPFWGNRGRRQGTEPFWGSRGRREEEPFWGNRGRRKESETFWDNRSRKKEDLKASILEAIHLVENDIERLSRLRRADQSFWSDRGRESYMKHLFEYPRNRITPHKIGRTMNMNLKSTEPGTLHDSRIYADEPQFILVERNSRSSAETEDPFYISRGKKYYINYNLIKAARDRRGAIEEIVKSVRNDPYYIARGKKDIKQNSTDEEIQKVKELICSTIDLITVQQENGKIKREIDSDRVRRTILKKLAARLQIDPFPISRGKKSEGNESNIHEFITNIAEKCN